MLCVAEVESHFCSKRRGSHAGDRSIDVHKMETDLTSECQGVSVHKIQMHQAVQQDPPILGAKTTVCAITLRENCWTLSGLCQQISETSS